MTHDLAHFTAYLVGHAHIDLGYRWRWNETVHRIARDTLRGVLRIMDEVPAQRWIDLSEEAYGVSLQRLSLCL